MIPPVTTTPEIVTPIPQLNSAISIAQPTTDRIKQVKIFTTSPVSDWKDRSPVTSPNLYAPPARRSIAQSELPGGSTTDQIPPKPSTRDTGSGYPNRVPTSYIGPAIGFGNGKSGFGVVSKFPYSENYSIRPSAVFGSGTVVRVPITYDFSVGDKEPFERNPLMTFFVGGGLQYSSGFNSNNSSSFGLLGTIGVDIHIFDGIAVVGSFNTDFASNNGTNIGFGFDF